MLDDALKLDEVAVEEVAGTRQHHDRQALRPRPGQYASERHDVVLLTVDDERALSGWLDLEAADRGRHQDQALGRRSAIA